MTGESTYVLAQRFGIHRQAVAMHLGRAGVSRRKGNSRATLDDATFVRRA